MVTIIKIKLEDVDVHSVMVLEHILHPSNVIPCIVRHCFPGLDTPSFILIKNIPSFQTDRISISEKFGCKEGYDTSLLLE